MTPLENPTDPLRETMTFSEYFSLNDDVETILQQFGYTYALDALALREYPGEIVGIDDFEKRFLTILRNVSATGEAGKREFLIAPLLFELVIRYNIKVRSEFTLKVSPRLQGMLDYLVVGEQNLIVIEAKQGDLQRGFRQLAAEMIAVDQWAAPSLALYGAVTLGDVWQFARLDRNTKQLTRDINFMNVPEDVGRLFRVLVALVVPADKHG